MNLSGLSSARIVEFLAVDEGDILASLTRLALAADRAAHWGRPRRLSQGSFQPVMDAVERNLTLPIRAQRMQ